MNRIDDDNVAAAADSKITMNPLNETNTDSFNDNDNTSIDSKSEQRLLSTPFMLTVLFIYTTFTILGTAACAAVGITVYNVKYGLSLNVVGGVTLLGTYVHFFAQLAIGYAGDKVSFGSYGRKKPFIIVGFMGQAAVIFFLFFVEYFVDTKNDSALVVWFLIFQILYEIFNAIILIPYQTWLIEVACNNNDYMRVVTTAIPSGMLIGGVIGLLLQLLNKTHVLFYLYAVGGCASTIAICYFVPSKKLTSIPAQPPYIPSFQTCIRLTEFKLVFIMTVIINLINSVYSNATSTFMSCSYFDFLQITGGADDEAVKSRHQFAWIVGFWVPGVLLLLGLISNLLLGYLMQQLRFDKIRLFQIFAIVYAFLIITSLSTTFSKTNTGLVFFVLMCCIPYGCYQALSTLQSIYLRDLICVDNLIFSLYRENMYYTAMNVPSNLMYSLIANLFPTLEYYTGYNTAAGGSITCSATFPWNLRFIMLFCALMCIPLYYVVVNYPLTTSLSSQLTTAQQLKEKDGKQVVDSLKKEDVGITTTTTTTTSDPNASDIQHMSTAEIFDVSTEPLRLQKIFIRNICTNMFILSAIALLFAGLVHQLIMPSSRSLQLLVSSLSLSFMFFLYELFRSMAIYNLYRQPKEVISVAADKEFKRLVALTNNLQETINKYCKVENYLEAGRVARVIDYYDSKYNVYGIHFSKSGVYYVCLLSFLCALIVLGALSLK